MDRPHETTHVVQSDRFILLFPGCDISLWPLGITTIAYVSDLVATEVMGRPSPSCSDLLAQHFHELPVKNSEYANY